MNGHPSRPPPLEPEGLVFFKGIRGLPVAIGALVDNAATIVLGLTVTGAIASGYAEPDGTLSEEALEALSHHPTLLAASMLIGTGCTALGGYVAGRMAGIHRLRHGAFVGLAAITLGLVSFASAPGGSTSPLWYDLLSFLLLVPAGLLGGVASGIGGAEERPDLVDR